MQAQGHLSLPSNQEAMDRDGRSAGCELWAGTAGDRIVQGCPFLQVIAVTTEADAFARNLLGLATLWINKDDKDLEKQNKII